VMWGKKYGKAIAPDVGRVKISILKVARDSRQIPTEVQGISFVGYTGSEGSKPRLWNLQNLCPVPP